MALAYARFSPKPKPRPGDDPAAYASAMEAWRRSNAGQLERCREFAARQCWTIAITEEDEETSGGEGARGYYDENLGIWRAVSALQPGWILLVDRLDRLSRSVYDLLEIQRAVKNKKARIVSVSGEGTEDDTPQAEAMRTIFTAFAEMQRKIIGARTKVAVLKHLYQDRKCRNKAKLCPWGLTPDPSDPKHLIANPVEVAIARYCHRRRGEGAAWSALARFLIVHGIPNRGAGEWVNTDIRKKLVARVDAGQMPEMDEASQVFMDYLDSLEPDPKYPPKMRGAKTEKWLASR